MTRFSGDHPVRRWSRGRFAFRRAAVAPLVPGASGDRGDRRWRVVTLLSASGPGMSPSAPTSMAWDPGTRASAGRRRGVDPRTSGSVDRAERELELVAPPGARSASSVPDVSGASSSTW